VWTGGGWREIAVWGRDAIGSDVVIEGPALIEVPVGEMPDPFPILMRARART